MKKTIGTCLSGPTCVWDLVLDGGVGPVLFNSVVCEHTELQEHCSNSPKKSDNVLVLMCQGTAGRGLTFLWLQFKEFESWNTTRTLYLRCLV